MAIWQFDCNIISKNKPLKNETLWDGKDFTRDIHTYMKDVLPLEKSWSPNIIQYGLIDSTCIEFYMENKKIVEICLRLDLLCLSKNLLNKILYFISQIEGNIFYDGQIYEPKVTIIVPLLKQSDAGKFIMNQEEYFKQLN